MEQNITLSKFDKFIKIYKIVLISLYAFLSLFLLVDLIYQYFNDLSLSKEENSIILGLPLTLILIVIIIGGISYCVLLISELIGLILVHHYGKVNKNKNKKFFILSIIITILTFVFLIGFGFILMNLYQINKIN